MRILVTLLLGLAAVSAAPKNGQRIVGGEVTTINQYPQTAALLFSFMGGFIQMCGGTILNERAILTAGHCVLGDHPSQWRTRVGSTYASDGGIVRLTQQFIHHPDYKPPSFDNDLSIIHTTTFIEYNNVMQPGFIAGPNYNPADNQIVWAAGWGHIAQGGPASEQLRHVQVYIINQETCAERYAMVGGSVTDVMLCSGVLDVGGRDQCQGDSGGPLFHNNVVVGVCSWGVGCASPIFPGVNVRVSKFTNWIAQNA